VTASCARHAACLQPAVVITRRVQALYSTSVAPWPASCARHAACHLPVVININWRRVQAWYPPSPPIASGCVLPRPREYKCWYSHHVVAPHPHGTAPPPPAPTFSIPVVQHGDLQAIAAHCRALHPRAPRSFFTRPFSHAIACACTCARREGRRGCARRTDHCKLLTVANDCTISQRCTLTCTRAGAPSKSASPA